MSLPEHVYHLAEASNWPAIRREGLLSAGKLIAGAGVRGARRDALERQQRTEGVELPTGVRLRDQCPMPASALARCLHGMTPAEWYALVNAHVFFWFDPERLNRQRKACGARPQVVLTIAVARLVAAQAERIELTPINTGNARRQPAQRGRATFVPYAVWLESRWASEAAALGTRERARSHAPVELTVREAVPDLDRLIVKVTGLRAGELFSPRG